MKRDHANRGAVLLLVLVLVVFAVMALTQVIERASPDLLLAVRRSDREHLRADAYDALETTLAVLADFRAIDGALHAPGQGWAAPLGVAGFEPRAGMKITVDFEDESGKASLPAVSREVLGQLLAQAGLGAAEAAKAADALYGWMHREPLTAGTDLRAQALAPPGRAPRAFAELAHVPEAGRLFYDAEGQETSVLKEFRRLVSLYRFEATNLNTASATVMAALGGTKPPLSRSGAAEHGREYFRTREEAGVASSSLATAVCLLRIHITVQRGAARLRLSALVTWDRLAVLPSGGVAEEMKSMVGPAKSPAEPLADIHYPFQILELSESALPECEPSDERAI